MKKEYFKPEITTENIITAECMMLNDSMVVGGTPGPSATNERRGKWGDVWEK